MTCIFTQNIILPQMFFKHFGNKNQLLGLSITRTLVENWLIQRFTIFKDQTSLAFLLHSICCLINPFIPKKPFLYPLKIWENFKVFWCFQEVERMCIGNKWVKTKTSLTFAVITVKFKLLVYALDFYPFWNVMTIFLMLSNVMNGQWCCSVNLSKPD